MFAGFTRSHSLRRIMHSLCLLITLCTILLTATAKAELTPEFNITATPSSVTAKPSGTATATITITPTPPNSLGNVVSLSCSGMPANSVCVFSADTIPAGSGPATSVLTFITGVKPGSTSVAGLGGLGVLACGVLTLGLFRRRRLYAPLFLMLAVCSGLMLNGCSENADTPAGTSNVVVTATGSGGGAEGVVHTATIQLVVQ